MKRKVEYLREEKPHGYRRWWVGGWVWPIGTALATLVWGLLIWWLIRDRPTTWNYGTVPYVPGSAGYATQPVPAGPVPRQITLPEIPSGRGQ